MTKITKNLTQKIAIIIIKTTTYIRILFIAIATEQVYSPAGKRKFWTNSPIPEAITLKTYWKLASDVDCSATTLSLCRHWLAELARAQYGYYH